MANVVDQEAVRLKIVPLIHMPIAQETALDAESVARLDAAERRALQRAPVVVVTGRATSEILTARDPHLRDRIVVVEPGTDRAPLARGAGAAPEVRLLCVGAVTPAKGHELLVRALQSIATDSWTLTCAGSVTRDPATADRVRAQILESGLNERVSFTGELSDADVSAEYDAADVFVLATLHETYGMAVAEALSRGLPVISTTTGAIPELVGSGEGAAGVLVAPGDVESLALALERLIIDEPLRRRFARNAARARDRLPTWDQACGTMARTLTQLK
jgi:glycosyltransferase involved in cell wall biosynthesis